jgi:hypothetical protein
MVQDLLEFAKALQIKLSEENDLMRNLKPMLNLIGSIAEDTRIVLANELDITVEFEGFEEAPFRVVEGDPFHLTVTENAPGKRFDKPSLIQTLSKCSLYNFLLFKLDVNLEFSQFDESHSRLAI